MPTVYSGLTVTEFAKQEGVSRALVYVWINQTPDLPVRKIGGVRILTPGDIQCLRRRPRNPLGRPKEKR
jgi:hypothetical protein